jgi:hypothetical protein
MKSSVLQRDDEESDIFKSIALLEKAARILKV